MKKVRFILAGLILPTLAAFSACKKSSDTPKDEPPAMSFVTGTGYISKDTTISVSSLFKVGLMASSNKTSGAKLVKLSLKRVFNNSPVSQDTTISTTSLAINILAQSVATPGQEQWYYTVTDANGQSKQLGLVITTIVTDGKEGLLPGGREQLARITVTEIR